MEIQVEIQPLNRSTGVRPTIRLCSADDKRVTAFGGNRFWPAITRRPTLNMTLFDGDFTGQIATGAGSMTISAFGLKRADANAPGYAWNAAPISIWSIVPETGARTLRFSGIVERFSSSNEQITIDIRVDTEAFVQNALPLTYAGTGGIEGPVDLRGKVKPLVLGRCFNVEPALINATDNVYQVSAYGPIDAVEVLYERGSAFGASFGDYASYAALVAAAIPNGGWATCLAQGLIRLKAPAYGVITADVRGDKPSGVLLRKTGEIINRLCSIASVPGANIDSASLTALDTALNSLPNQGRIGIYLTEQVRLLDLIQQLARPCNAAAGISWLGQLFVCRTTIGSAAAVFDAQGRRRPAISAVSEQSVSPPYWRIEMQGARSWRVHSDAEIAQGFIPGDEVANAVAPNAANRVRYSLMEGGQGWVVASILPVTGNYFTAGGRKAYAATATATAAGQIISIGSNPLNTGAFPLTGGERISLQARIGNNANVASVLINLGYTRADGSYDEVFAYSGGPTDWLTVVQKVFVTAPADAVQGVWKCYAFSAAAGEVVLILSEPFIASAAEGQTAHPAFTPGPNAENGATVGAPTGTNVAGVAAATLVADAATAKADSASALSTLSTIANDAVLSRDEKPDVRQKRDAVIGEFPTIRDRADNFGVSRTAYATAYTYLIDYLATLDLAGATDTAIARSTFNGRFTDYYTLRQTVLDGIALVASQRANLMPSAVNAVVNSDFTRGKFGFGWAGGAFESQWGVNLTGTPNWFGQRNVMWATSSGVLTTGAVKDLNPKTIWAGFPSTDAPLFALSVVPGERLFASVLAAAHRCTFQLYILIFDAAFNLISAPNSSGGRPGGAANGDPANFDLLTVIGDVPANARWAIPMFRMLGTGESDPFIFFTEPMFGKMAAGQTVIPAYVSGRADLLADATRDTLPALNRGAWSASSVAYALGDIVTRAGSSYTCMIAHTSTAGNGPPGANWALLADAGVDGAPGAQGPTGVSAPPVKALPTGAAQFDPIRLENGQTVTVAAELFLNTGGVAGVCSLELQISPAGTGSWATMTGGTDSDSQPTTEPVELAIAGATFTNSSGAARLYDIRAVSERRSRSVNTELSGMRVL